MFWYGFFKGFKLPGGIRGPFPHCFRCGIPRTPASRFHIVFQGNGTPLHFVRGTHKRRACKNACRPNRQPRNASPSGFKARPAFSTLSPLVALLFLLLVPPSFWPTSAPALGPPRPLVDSSFRPAFFLYLDFCRVLFGIKCITRSVCHCAVCTVVLPPLVRQGWLSGFPAV